MNVFDMKVRARLPVVSSQSGPKFIEMFMVKVLVYEGQVRGALPQPVSHMQIYDAFNTKLTFGNRARREMATWDRMATP